MKRDLGEDKNSVQENLLALAIGQNCLTWMREFRISAHEKAIDSLAVRILEEIQRVVDDKSYSDPECFAQIERIVSVFRIYGIPSERHIEYD